MNKKYIISIIIVSIAVIGIILFVQKTKNLNDKQKSNIDNKTSNTVTTPKIYTIEEVAQIETALKGTLETIPDLDKDFPCDQIKDDILNELCYMKRNIPYENLSISGWKDTDDQLEQELGYQNTNPNYITAYDVSADCNTFPLKYQNLCRYKKNKTAQCKRYESTYAPTILKQVCEYEKGQ